LATTAPKPFTIPRAATAGLPADGAGFGDVTGRGPPIAGWTALQNVGDIDRLWRFPFSRHPEAREHVVEQSSGLSDERFTARVFFRTRGFADQHPIGARVPDSKDGLLSRLA
jgi:hypothetical protein